MRKASVFVFLVTCLFVTRSFGLITTMIQHSNRSSAVIELWCDDHFVGTLDENQQQLKIMIENVLTKTPLHLIIESKFFAGLDYLNMNSNDCLREFHRQYSDVKQDSSSPTWIGWDLPLVLMKIMHNEELPPYIALSSEQISFIQKNVTYALIDRRLALEVGGDKSEIRVEEVANLVFANFESSVNSSKWSFPEKISHEIKSIYESAKEGDRDALDHIVDIEIMSNLITHLRTNSKPKKIMILCGTWHALFFDTTLLPALELPVRKEYHLHRPTRKSSPSSLQK